MLRKIGLAFAVTALAVTGIAAIAQADQPGGFGMMGTSPGTTWDDMADHMSDVHGDDPAGWWDDMADHMSVVHGDDPAGWWDEMADHMPDVHGDDPAGWWDDMADLHGDEADGPHRWDAEDHPCMSGWGDQA